MHQSPSRMCKPCSRSLGWLDEVESLDIARIGCNTVDGVVSVGWDSFTMSLWRTLKGKWAMTYPNTVFIGKAPWGLSYRRFSLALSEDTTTPYSILHVGPFEFFIRPKSVIF
jgi:hypothetical protein